MEIITVTKDNLQTEHICCAISNDADCQVSAKKSWLSERFEEGLVFKKGNVRGKCFIEYIPAERAWAPINADGYMYIDCLWVSGQFQGQGNAALLLDECIKDSKEKGKQGLVILSSDKKRSFLSDPEFLKHKGFRQADAAEPYFRLYHLPFSENSAPPQFKPHAKSPRTEENGFVLYYTKQCPFTAKYVPLIENIAKERGISFKTIRFKSAEEAQAAPCPFTSYSLFKDGKFITHEILSEKKFEKLLNAYNNCF